MNIQPMLSRASQPVASCERIGHRGAPREILENTLPSFSRALERGAGAVELDVHVSSDGVPVVHHDPEIGRAIDPRALGRSLASMTAQEIAQVELAPGIAIPTLEQVLQLVAGRATAYVELKGLGAEAASIAVIRASGASCAVHSFDHLAVARAKRLAPELPRGILFEEYPADVAASMKAAAARDVWPNWRLIDERLVRTVHDLGGRVIAWTVNDAHDAARLATLGVDGLCTDDVRILPPNG